MKPSWYLHRLSVKAASVEEPPCRGTVRRNGEKGTGRNRGERGEEEEEAESGSHVKEGWVGRKELKCVVSASRIQLEQRNE